MIEEILQQILEEQKNTNKLLQDIISTNNCDSNGKNSNDMLTIVQVAKEYNIGINKVREIFNDPTLAVQRYTIPFKVKRKVFEEYFDKSHDNLRHK